MNKKILLLVLICSLSVTSQNKKEKSQGVLNSINRKYQSIKNSLFSEDNAERDSILTIYKSKFKDYKLVTEWMSKKPPFLDDLKGNTYKVLKRTIIEKDNSIIYDDLVKKENILYLFVPEHKEYLYFLSFELFENFIELIDVTKVNRGIMYEDKFEVKLDEEFKIEKEIVTGRVKPFFEVYNKHLIFGYKVNSEGGDRRVYYDLGFDLFDEDEKDSYLEYANRYWTLGLTELNKTEQLINDKMLYKL